LGWCLENCYKEKDGSKATNGQHQWNCFKSLNDISFVWLSFPFSNGNDIYTLFLRNTRKNMNSIAIVYLRGIENDKT